MILIKACNDDHTITFDITFLQQLIDEDIQYVSYNHKRLKECATDDEEGYGAVGE